MTDLKIRRIEEIPYYQGPKAIPGIKFHSAARELGVTAWGMGLLELDANCQGYPEHDHQHDRQEEVYVVLKGGGTVKTDDGETPIEAGTLIRVGPDTKRKFLAGAQGLTLLAIGATPGKAYGAK